jgi:hypothetical protein
MFRTWERGGGVGTAALTWERQILHWQQWTCSARNSALVHIYTHVINMLTSFWAYYLQII